MIILVLNCGSSSLKYQVLDMKGEGDFSLLAKGIVERIGMEVGDIVHKLGDDKYVINKPIPTHTEGIKSVLELLTDSKWGVVGSLEEIDAVGHRVAHGGEKFPVSCIVDPSVIEGIEQLCELAPLHNPANLLGIRAVDTLMPGTPQVAVFDTSFHQTMPEHAYMYPIPYEYYEKYRARRYGFHGTSHKYVAERGCKVAGLDLNNSKVVTCHLGNGGSVTAIHNGKSVDTSMGFTPMEGVVMGTRCGNIDAGLVTFLQEKEGLNIEGVSNLLNKKSGLLGISGVSSDSRDVNGAADKGDHRAKLALDMFNYSVKKYIGAYSAVMGGLDLIVFTGGIGENDAKARERICSTLGYLGVDFDSEFNSTIRGEDAILTKKGSKVTVAIIPTNEELVIATDTMNLVSNK